MPERKSWDAAAIRAKWDERARAYDSYYRTFRGAVEHYVDWELLKRHLPKDRNARILDAAGGTGRITLPLAEMGYPVALCDISPAMLEVARQKLLREGLLARVEIVECDIGALCFADESFDFVLCWSGMFEAVGELVRVTRRGGALSVFLVNRCRGAVDLLPKDPAMALALIEGRSDSLRDEGESYRVVGLEEARQFFEAQRIRIRDIYAVCGWTDLLHLPPELREAGQWEEGFFGQVAETVLRLSQEPSAKGVSRHLVVYGDRI